MLHRLIITMFIVAVMSGTAWTAEKDLALEITPSIEQMIKGHEHITCCSVQNPQETAQFAQRTPAPDRREPMTSGHRPELRELTPDDVDLVVNGKEQRMYILHSKPLQSQGHIRSVLYNQKTYQFTFIAEDGAEQLLKNIVVTEPLRKDVLQCRTVILMLVVGENFVVTEVQKVPLLFRGN
jgi:hypothetical protein